MNDKIRKHLTAINEKNGWITDDKSLFETIRDMGKLVYTEIGSSHRWYDEVFKVVELEGMLIGYKDFHITGDNSVADMGLKYDADSICEVVKKQKTVDYYEKVSEKEVVKKLGENR